MEYDNQKHFNRLTVVDLFSGAGGLSLGAAAAGFKVVASVENDKKAIETHSRNFPGALHIDEDIRLLTGQSLFGRVGGDTRIDGIIGGPPCQGFSVIGRRTESDARNDLFEHFFRLVSEIRPAFYLAENVPGILAGDGIAVVKRALQSLPPSYKALEPFIVKASDYGAPTTRRRVFFVGYDPRRVNDLEEADFSPSPDQIAVTVGDALSALPPVKSSWQKERDSWRVIGEIETQSDYVKNLNTLVPNAVGDQLALERFKLKREVSGFLGTKHSEDTKKRFGKLKPGEVDVVYRSPRLDVSGLCPTLRAGTGKDRGSYQAVRPIHPTSARVISPREAARLQGFPDWFVFDPTKWHSFRQIGNSVSPIVAKHLLSVILDKVKS